MTAYFEGFEEHLPRFLRQELIALDAAGIVRIDQVQLPDAQIKDSWIADELAQRWKPGRPFWRCAHAALAFLDRSGVDIRSVHLHGRDVDHRITPYFVGFQLRYLSAALSCFEEHGGVEWIEIVHPTLRQPLSALRLRPGDQGKVVNRPASVNSFFH